MSSVFHSLRRTPLMTQTIVPRRTLVRFPLTLWNHRYQPFSHTCASIGIHTPLSPSPVLRAMIRRTTTYWRNPDRDCRRPYCIIPQVSSAPTKNEAPSRAFSLVDCIAYTYLVGLQMPRWYCMTQGPCTYVPVDAMPNIV